MLIASGKGIKKEPHVFFAVMVSGLMALGLAGGLEFIGVMGVLNGWLMALMGGTGLAVPERVLGWEVVWMGAVLLSFLLAAVIMNVAGMWRRLLVWVVTVVLTIFWVPVLWLAAHKPEIGVAVVVVIWSGFCAMVYATNHVMPADRLVMKKGGDDGEG